MPTKAIFNWSGGKDSSLALNRVLKQGDHEILCLLTSVNSQYQRVSMHGVRRELLKQQAESIGLPLVEMLVPDSPSMDDYESAMRAKLQEIKQSGATVSIFGDIFLEDLRQYRENRLSEVGLRGEFPVWKIPTDELAREFVDLGFKAITTCVNDRYLDKSFVGRELDASFFRDLPSNVDPCGENGEFHTFVYDGPIFSRPIEFTKGEIVQRRYEPPQNKEDDNVCGRNDTQADTYAAGFWYCDLIPK